MNLVNTILSPIISPPLNFLHFSPFCHKNKDFTPLSPILFCHSERSERIAAL